MSSEIPTPTATLQKDLMAQYVDLGLQIDLREDDLESRRAALAADEIILVEMKRKRKALFNQIRGTAGALGREEDARKEAAHPSPAHPSPANPSPADLEALALAQAKAEGAEVRIESPQ